MLLLGKKIKQHEENIKYLRTHKNSLDDVITDMQGIYINTLDAFSCNFQNANHELFSFSFSYSGKVSFLICT